MNNRGPFGQVLSDMAKRDKLTKITKIFGKGCGNGSNPADCEECLKIFVDKALQIAHGEKS